MSRSNLPMLRDEGMFSDLGVGVGLRPTHYSDVLSERPVTPWFEAISENYLGTSVECGGRSLEILDRIRRDHAIVLHGVSLSIGSTDPLNLPYLKRLRGLIDRVQPAWVSDHICWTGAEGENLHDLLPLPFTEESLRHLTARIQRVQDRLGRRMIFENVSSYLTFKHSEMTEWEFLEELCRRADCGLLLDLNNIYVSSVNQGFDPVVYLEAISPERVGQLHLAGHSKRNGYLLDTHDQPVSPAVWELYRMALRRFGAVSTLIEWDASIPKYSVLEAEAVTARRIRLAELERRVPGESRDLGHPVPA